jgi:hypothetical protein
MPCYRCGTRQVDPDRGESPWRRGVSADRQVLICPECQVTEDWTRDLDRCPVCTSVHLVKRLGEVECRDCGAVGLTGVRGDGAAESGSPVGGAPVGGAPAAQAASAGADLADEVERALARVLGPSRQRPPYAMS